MTPPDVDRCVAELERMRERQADYLLMAQGTAESEPIRERIEALDAAIRALRQGGEPVVWVSPDDLANPNFVGISAAKAGHESLGKHYTMPLYAAPPSPTKEG